MRNRFRGIGFAWLLLGLGVFGSASTGWAEEPAEIFRGLSLEEALEKLRLEGLPLVFSSELVPPELQVEAEPSSGSRREIAEALLAAHGLGLREVSQGRRLVVVARPRNLGKIAGRVVDATGVPVEGARVEDADAGRRAITNSRGSFELRSLPAGRRTIRIEAPALASRVLEVGVRAGGVSRLEVSLEPGASSEDTIEVTAEWPWVAGDGLSVHVLTQEDLRSMPHFGDDLFRGLESLPGATASDGSAHLHVRGGEQRELLVLVDGQELLEPFHLKDFNDALGVIRPTTVERVEIITGGFGAEYGDRLTGVLDLVTLSPGIRTRGEVALGPLQVEAGRSGRRPEKDGRGGAGWMVDARYGSLEIPFRLADEEENPTFWDLFAKWDASDQGRGWRVQALLAGDQLDFVQTDNAGEPDEISERFQTEYRNLNLWTSHQMILGSDLILDHRAGGIHLARDRDGRRISEDDSLSLLDERELDMLVLAHQGRVRLAGGHSLRWGVEGRRLEAGYDYRDAHELAGPLAPIRDLPPVGATQFEQAFDGEQLGLFVSDSWQRGDLTVEAGLRFDENTVIDDDHTSPRLSLAWAVNESTRLRGAIGRYSQSQRLYELQVEDGETEFAPTERATSWGLGLEHELRTSGRRPLTLRVEVYQRRIRNPRPRWENLFEPVSLVPELEEDRVRIAPDRTRAEGVELFLGGAAGPKIDYFLTYTWSRVEDQIATVWTPRAVDQPHALGADVFFRDVRGWELAAAARIHTGWPTTELTARLEEGPDGEEAVVPVLGPLRGERLRNYFRVDLRASRVWELGGRRDRGELELAIEVRNATNSTLERGAELEFELPPSGGVRVERTPKTWFGPLPNLTLRWRF